MFATHTNCLFSTQKGATTTLSFFAKGVIGNQLKIALVVNGSDEKEATVKLTSADWSKYTVSFKNKSDATDANIRLTFTDLGDYFIDDLTINTYDCSGELGGSALLDSCDICSGGSTGLTFLTSCAMKTITPDHPNFRFDGTLEQDISSSKASFYRFKKNYAINSVSGYYSHLPAQSTSGVQVVFKTASPTLNVFFQKDAARSPASAYWSSFDVYQNGVLVGQYENDYEFTLTNATGKSAEWLITLPTGTAAELVKLEIVDGYNLEAVSPNNKPIYVAIGNSMTMGTGTVYHHTPHTYPWIIADSLNYHLYNWGIGGSAIYDQVLSNFDGTITPDLITVLWGYNDVHFGGDTNSLETKSLVNYKSLIEGLLTRFPAACIAAILPIYAINNENPSYPTTRTMSILRQRQSEILNTIKALHSNLTIVDGLLYSDASSLHSDNVHPSITGNKRLAEGILSEKPCEKTVQVYDQSVEQFIIYPNPTSGIFHWNQNLEYQVLDLSGKVLSSGIGSAFDLSSFQNGIYFLQIPSRTYKIAKH